MRLEAHADPRMVTVELRESPDVWVLRLSGTVPAEEVRRGLQSLRARSDGPVALPIVMDGRSITDSNDAAAHMREIADDFPAGAPPGRNAMLVIVATRDVDYGNARVFEARFASELQREIRVVRTWDEAVQALGLTAEQLPDPMKQP
jgi:hypothetical protein